MKNLNILTQQLGEPLIKSQKNTIVEFYRSMDIITCWWPVAKYVLIIKKK